MKLFGFLTATASCLDLSTLMMMQQGGLGGLLGGAQAPAAGGDMMGGLMNNPFMLYQMMSGNSIFGGDSSIEKFLPLLMGGNMNMANLLPLLALTDKKEETPASPTAVVFKPETDYQAACNGITDVTKKINCITQIYDIFDCQASAKSLDVADLGTAFDTFNAEVNKFTSTGACTNKCDGITIPTAKADCVKKAEAAHNAIFPPSASSSSSVGGLFDDPIMMMMMMNGQNMFNMMSGGVGAANGLTGMNPMLLNALLKN